MPPPERFLVVSLCLILIGSSRPDAAWTAPQTSTPDTPAGRSLSELLGAYNTGESDSLRAYFLTHATQATAEQRQEAAARRAAWVGRIYQGYRELRLDRIERSTEWEISALLQSEVTEGWGRLEIEVDAQPPHGIGIGFYEASRPSDRPLSGVHLNQTEILAVLDGYLKKLFEAGLFCGAVLVAKDGTPIFQQAHGWAEASSMTPNEVDSKFTLASMSKMFTAVAILQLHQAGRLSLEDSIGKHLPEYPSPEAAAKVTLYQLLTHTSGMGDYLDKEEFLAAREAAGGRFESPRMYFPYFADDSLLFVPGERFEYSNAGYIVLGAIVEAASGQGYFDYVTERIFEPAGMQASDPRGITGSPAGSALSTVEDLLRFANALRAHRLLDAKFTEMLLTPRTEANIGGNYAFGFIVRTTADGKRIVGHDGGSGGVSTKLDIYLDQPYTVVILENMDPPAAKNVAAKLEALIVGE